MPDQGSYESDNSSIFSSPSPSSRHRRSDTQSSPVVKSRPRDHAAVEAVSSVGELSQQMSPVDQTLSPTGDLGRPLSFVLAFQTDENLADCISVVDGCQKQVE